MSPTTPPAISCDDEFDPNSLTVSQAQARIMASSPPPQHTQQLALREALGRVLAVDITSPVAVPAHANSAVDGYAVRSADLEKLTTLPVCGESFAGRPFTGPLPPGSAIRIMTGAVVPDEADTVVMQEHVARSGDAITLLTRYQIGQNVRSAGEDIQPGAIALTAGHTLMPVDIGVLASLGISQVECWNRPRVAFFSTGDELRSLGEPLGSGEIYDSNRYTLYGMLSRLPVEIRDLGVVKDSPDAIRAALLAAAAEADVVITSGGVSVGEADFIKQELERIGSIGFWKVALKPGRPLAFGSIGDATFFGLPGNPVSVMVTFYQFVKPALLTMAGARYTPPLRVTAICTSQLKKKAGRLEYQRGVLSNSGPDGALVVHRTGDQGSGILSSMSQANCFIVLPLDCTEVAPGSPVQVEPFYGIV